MTIRLLAFALVCGCTASLATAADAPGSPFRTPRFEVKRTNAVVYGKAGVKAPAAGEKDLLLDLYEPQGKDLPPLRPAMIVIHGGGFKGGSRAAPNMSGLCRELTSRGFVCISIDYRMQGDDPDTEGRTLMERAIRAAVLDAGAAHRWLVANAGKYKIDPNRIAVGGGSAGAITSLLLTYGRQDDPEDRPKIAAVVNLWGSMYRATNSIAAGDPPVIIIHGTEDKVVAFSGAEEIRQRCAEVGVVCEFCPIEGAGHGVGLTQTFEGVPLLQRIVNFLDTHLKLAELASPK